MESTNKMSLDNGVFILVLRSEHPSHEKEYRVAFAHAIENIFNDPETLIETFEHSDVFYDMNSAKSAANKIDLIEDTEYGVATLTQFKNHTWSDINDITGITW